MKKDTFLVDVLIVLVSVFTRLYLSIDHGANVSPNLCLLEKLASNNDQLVVSKEDVSSVL